MTNGLSPEVRDARPVRALAAAFSDIGPLRNDLFSDRKEIGGEGEINNGVVVVQRFLRCGLQEAANVLADLAGARLREFQHVAAGLPVALAAAGFDAATRARVDGHAARLQDWMAGDLRWSRQTGRYHERPALAGLLGGPTGLGTAAAQLAKRKGGRLRDRPNAVQMVTTSETI